MQPVIEPPRSHLTEAQVRYLIEEAPSLIVGKGLELTDLQQSTVEDISTDFEGGTVERSSYATLHGTARLDIARVLPWGSAVVRPYLTLSDGLITARFNLGAYFTNTPRRPTRQQPPLFDVTCYDLLYGLDTVVGDAYSVAAGDLILDRVEAILIARGYTRYIIDRSRADAVAPDSKSWAMDQAVHWLTIVNDLLAMVGYQGVWADWNGYLRCGPYSRPVERPYEWYLSADSFTSILGDDASVEFDYHDAPNRWVGVRANNIDDAAPVEGDGVYTYQNDTNGPTSVEGRANLVITRQESIDVASHADLITAVQSMADADMSIPTTIAAETGVLPLAWHFDRYLVDDPDIGVPSEVLGTAWTLPLDGSNMTHSWTVLAGVES